jgi:hypothetical protein
MKKLLVLVCVLALASMANATTVDWSVSAVTVEVGATITVQISASDNGFYDDIWVGNDPGGAAEVTSITEILNNAGDNGRIDTPAVTEYPGWYVVAAIDMSEPFDSVVAGAQFDAVITGLSEGSYDLYCDAGTLTVTVVPIPEPATIALLCLGGLLLRKKK